MYFVISGKLCDWHCFASLQVEKQVVCCIQERKPLKEDVANFVPWQGLKFFS